MCAGAVGGSSGTLLGVLALDSEGFLTLSDVLTFVCASSVIMVTVQLVMLMVSIFDDSLMCTLCNIALLVQVLYM